MSQVSVTIGARNDMAGGLAAAARDVKKWQAQVNDAQRGTLVLEGEQKVKRAAANITSGILSANSAGEALVSTLGNVENAFKSSLAGGVGAVGMLAVASAVVTAKEKYEQFTASYLKAVNQVRDVSLFGSPAENLRNFETIKQQLDETSRQRKELLSFKGSSLSFLGQAIGGDTEAEKLKALNDRREHLFALEEKSLNRVVHGEEQSLQLTRLRLAGKTDEANLLDAQIKLSEELLKIDSLRLGASDQRLRNVKIEQFVEQAIAGAQKNNMDDAWNEIVKAGREKKKADDAMVGDRQDEHVKAFEAQQKATAQGRAEFGAREMSRIQERTAEIHALAGSAKENEVNAAKKQAVDQAQAGFEKTQADVAGFGKTGSEKRAEARAARAQSRDDRRRAGREAERLERQDRKLGRNALSPEEKRAVRDTIQKQMEDYRSGKSLEQHLANIEGIMHGLDVMLVKR